MAALLTRPRTALIGLICAVLSACGATRPAPAESPAIAALTPAPPAARAAPLFEPRACWEPAPPGFDATCGTVDVPEQRREPLAATNRVRLAVMVLHARGSSVAADPILLLTGGPGQGAIHTILDAFRHYREFSAAAPAEELYPGYAAMRAQYVATFELWLADLARRDLVLYDQRGTGYSEPALDCHEPRRVCYDRLVREGVDLSAYTAVASAADVDAVRQALGYEQVNLVGGSYGSRLGLLVLRDYPGGVRSAVFDGISPPHANHFVESVRLYQDVLDTLFAHCRAQAACEAAYPDLQARFYRLVARLNAAPASIPVGPDGATAPVSGDDLLQLVWEALYHADAIRFLPLLIDDLDRGEGAVLAEHVRLQSLNDLGSFSDGLHQTMLCAEEVRLADWDDVVDAAADLDPAIRPSVLRRARAIADGCDAWPVAAIDPAERRPAVSDVPVLLLSGEFDSGTPPAFGEAVAARLSNASHYVLPGLGHAEIFRSPCRSAIVSAFLAEPEVAPDVSCIAAMPELQFFVSDPAT